jgi:putative ABC transport system ATP-binding protein
MGAGSGQGDSMIEIEDVSHAYRIGTQTTCALAHISLTIRPGEILCVSGPSGSGKSTLLSVMGCLLTPDAGAVRIMGHDVAGLGDAARAALRRDHLGFIFQSFNLVPVLSAFENVEYPLILCGVDRQERRDRTTRMLQRVGLDAHMRKRPDQLSGGQKQRVAIARALIAAPGFVLADEPTANLDSHNATAILALMRELNEELQTAFIFSTHDPRVASFAQKCLVLEDGVLRA